MSDHTCPKCGHEWSEEHDAALERRIFDFWRRLMGKDESTRFTAKRRQKIRSRLAGYPAEDIERAARNCERSDFHMKRGKYATRDGPVHNDIELICRSDDKLEYFRDMFPEDGSRAGLPQPNGGLSGDAQRQLAELGEAF